ncbi:MAG: SIMPL domain-containing protein [Gammaproteobacteria bacterium]|jgi:predicted secreted protein|nr:SIMPL domain-containing protein [Gammaproteobacteria bacterium]
MSHRSATFPALSLSLLLFLSPVANTSEHEPELLDRVEFSVQVQREVPSEVARAVMVVERENVDPATLAREINGAMGAALDIARGQGNIQIRTGNYRTWPVHERQRILRWRSAQELILETEDATALHELLGRLQQQQMLLRSLDYRVSAERMASVEAELTTAALGAFRERAELIRDSLGAGGYDIVHLRIDRDGSAPPMMMRAMAMTEDAVAVAGEPGTQRVTATVHSVIRMK